MKVKLGKSILTAEKAAKLCGGTVIPEGKGGASFEWVCTDSREADGDTLFCAIRGERSDGHDYMICCGSHCVLCEKVPQELPEGITFIKVTDTVSALSLLAAGYREGEVRKTVAVTGSVGKTTTKEFISAALPADKTYRTKGNYNSIVGLPLSLLEIPAENEYAVLEMGMSGRGEIKLLSETAKPDIAVITNIGTSHLEMLGTRENIREAKLEILSGLKMGGVLLINGDDPMLNSYKVNAKTLSVGINNPKCDYRAVNLQSDCEKTVFDIVTSGKIIKNITIPTVGNHNVMAALFAYAVAELLGVDEKNAIDGISSFEKPKMRQNIFEVGGITIIEDCYNACPESMKAALEVLGGLSDKRGGARKAALLGNMLELGNNTRQLHGEVGEYAAKVGLDVLVAYGSLALCIAENAEAPKTVWIKDTQDYMLAAEALISLLHPGDILLVKASRALAVEKITEILKERL